MHDLAIGDLAEAIAGDHAGICGTVRLIVVDKGKVGYAIETQNGEQVECDGEDVRPIVAA